MVNGGCRRERVSVSRDGGRMMVLNREEDGDDYWEVELGIVISRG